MTPSGWVQNDIVLLVFAWMFGGLLLVALPAGLLVGRSTRRAEAGIGTGLTVWGVGNLLTALVGTLWLQFDTVVVTLQPTRCEVRVDGKGREGYVLHYAVPAASAGATTREAEGGLLLRGTCPPQADLARDRMAWRARRDTLADPRAKVRLDDAEEGVLPLVIIGSVFGGAGVLMGGLLLAHLRSEGKPDRPTSPPAVWRQSLGARVGQLGGLVFLAAIVLPFLLPGSLERAVGFGLRALATALGLLIVGGLLGRTLHGGAAAFLGFFALVALGVATMVKHTGLG